MTDINKGAFLQGDPSTTTYSWNFENQVVEHWAFGLMVEHQLDEKLFLAWTNTYYPNRIFEVYCNGVAPCNFFRFDSWRTDLAVKRSFADAVLLGMGLGLNYIHNPEIGRYSSGNYSKVSLNTFNGAYFEYTAQMSLAYWYKRYMIEVAYFKGFGHRGIDREMLRPINELNLTLILTIKWFATANLLNVSIYAEKWLAPMSQTTSYCVYPSVGCKLKKNECAKLKLSGKKELDREEFLPVHILKQLFQSSNGAFGFFRHSNPTLKKPKEPFPANALMD